MLTDLRKLKHVVEVAESGSFTGAASALAITQSALTKSVADVEARLGVRLFERLPRGVALTDAGQLFVNRSRGILADTADLMSQLDDHRDLRTGRLRVGITPAAMQVFLVAPLAGFASRYPGLQVEVTDGPAERMAQSLIGGEVDVIVGATNFLDVWPELSIDVIVALKYSFIGRRHHPAAGSPELTEKDLLQYPMVVPATNLPSQTDLARAFSRVGLPQVTPRYVVDYFPLVTEIVSATDAISPVISLTPLRGRLRDEFHVFEGVIRMDPQTIGIATSRNRELSPAASAFTEIVQEYLAA
ncbi:MAG: LysR family transcriptional regulator [Gammaproteobacteria bacterium]|nr:LysR family transcriptional regulator [Gammaproteobacteria bacterium]